MNYTIQRFRAMLPPVTRNLLVINIFVWLVQQLFLLRGIDISLFLGLKFFPAESFYPHQLITYAFLHDVRSFGHIFFNMFSLVMFGGMIERTMGGGRFLLYYGVCLISAALIQEFSWYWELRDLLHSSITTINMGGEFFSKSEYFSFFVTIGASGAVFGLLLAFGMLFPRVPMYIMFIPIPIQARYLVIGYGLLELFFGLSSRGDGIAHYAHLGGMLGGLLLMLYWRRYKKLF